MLVLFLAMTLGRLRLGAQITARGSGAWYHSLAKPAYTPPDWIFGPVWTVLYILMAVAAWLVWRRVGIQGRKSALVLFTVQLALNLLWSILFFGNRDIGLSFGEIILLLATLLFTLWKFAEVDRTAALVFLPYVLWVVFAAMLNGEIFWHN